MLNGLESVKAGEHRVGGVAGSVTTASVTGLLNNTLGVGSFLGFTVHSVTVTGVDAGYAVTALCRRCFGRSDWRRCTECYATPVKVSDS